MNENEESAATAGALHTATMASAERSRFWAGLNTSGVAKARSQRAVAASAERGNGS